MLNLFTLRRVFTEDTSGRGGDGGNSKQHRDWAGLERDRQCQRASRIIESPLSLLDRFKLKRPPSTLTLCSQLTLEMTPK